MAPRDLQLVILDQWENGIKPQFADENTQWVVKMPWVEVQGAIEQPKVLLDRLVLCLNWSNRAEFPQIVRWAAKHAF